MGLFSKPAKAATPAEQQASVGYYDEIGSFRNILHGKKIKLKVVQDILKRVTLSPDELARLQISDDLRSKLAQFSHLFKADNPIYDDYMYNKKLIPENEKERIKLDNPGNGMTGGFTGAMSSILPTLIQSLEDKVNNKPQYERTKISPFGGGMFDIAQNMAPGMALQSRMNNMAGLQGQLDYQPMYQGALWWKSRYDRVYNIQEHQVKKVYYHKLHL